MAPASTGPQFASPLILTGSDFRFIVTEQLSDIGIDPGAVLIEPEGRNTAPAVLAAALYLAGQDPDAVMLVAPSDHAITDGDAFSQAVGRAMPAVAAGQMVTFGIRPDAPETCYGYLELATGIADTDGPQSLLGFVEKPDGDAAQAMLSQGNFLWNAGIFLFRADTIIQAFEDHAPDLVDPVTDALMQARPDLGFLRLAADPWAKCKDISIDYAVMEHAKNLSVVALDCGWSDLGAWSAVWQEGPLDGDGVTRFGPATAIDCQNTLLRSESETLELVGIGLNNVVAVAMPDAVLVADMSRTQDVKKAVAALKLRGAKQAEAFPRDHRPWGWFESLVKGDGFQVKRIVVHPGGQLSLQSHKHRAEHWVVVQGTAKVTVGETVQMVGENQSVYVPVGVRHRMENTGTQAMVLIEVQTGSYLGEDDIERYEDLYARQ